MKEKTTIYIDKNIKKAMKILAIQRDTTLSALVEEALKGLK